jgi:hypothetical protein
VTRSFRPTLQVTVDGRALSGPQAATVAVQVDLGVGAAHDRALVAVAAASPVASPAPGAATEVALGYGDDRHTVLTGSVSRVDGGPWGSVVEVLAPTAALSRSRTGRSFVSQSVADIVAALAGQAGVATGEIEAPLRLAAYHADERRSIWDHLQELARLAGCETSCDEQGRLRFRSLPGSGGLGGGVAGLAAAATGAAASLVGGGARRLRHGSELAGWWTHAEPVPEDAVEVVPFGNSSGQGLGQWHVVLKEPDGGAPSGLVLVPGAVRDRDAADALQAGRRGRDERGARRATVVTLGDAAIRPGDGVALENLPAGDGDYRVVAVRHELGPRTGFCTTLSLEAA